MDSSPENENENYLPAHLHLLMWIIIHIIYMSSQTNMTFCLLWNMKLAFLRNLEVSGEQNFLVTNILQNTCFVQKEKMHVWVNDDS